MSASLARCCLISLFTSSYSSMALNNLFCTSKPKAGSKYLGEIWSLAIYSSVLGPKFLNLEDTGAGR